MKILIDDADIDKIKSIYAYFPIDGVTTNPTILAKAKRKPYEVLKEIREFIGHQAELHVQVVSRTAEEMVDEGHKIAQLLGINTYIKVPTIVEGLKAMRILSSEGHHVTATAIYTPMQAFLAAKAGADYTAPYVNRIENLGADGMLMTKKIQDIYNTSGMKTQIIAASFKNSQQVQELCEYGVRAATLAPDVIENLIINPCVDSAVNSFIADFEDLCGPGKTMRNCDK